jgi:bifunctional DNA-binding transcriptional regulator/antitoxin component of YhaV-PrlF toxin-antitoxin module
MNFTQQEVRKRIRLEDHQVVVVKDENGKYIIKKGTDKERSFFLQPYWELVAVMWSTGIHKDKKALRITHFDCRPQFTWVSFYCIQL